MQCDICIRPFTQRRKPTCPSCARAALYPARLEQAAALLAREKAHSHIEAVVRPGNDGVLAALPEDANWDAITTGIHTHGVERMMIDVRNAEHRIAQVIRKAGELRQQMEKYKSSIEQQRAKNGRRRKELEQKKAPLEQNDARAMEAVRNVVEKIRQRTDRVHRKTADARDQLCRTAASLSGLKKVRHEDGRSEYYIAGLLLPDLRDLNGISGKLQNETVETTSGKKVVAEAHEIVSAILDHASRLLGISCHYLSIRLPAQIILPHDDFPHTAILPRDSSYRANHVRYSGSTSSQSASPAASRILQRNDLSRPRLLKLDRALPLLQKEDPKAALLFLEGTTLLAYDIAWLCRAQGLEGASSFSEVCSIGHNLYQLFYRKDSRSQTRPNLNRNVSSASTKTAQSAILAGNNQPQFGSHSHSSSQHSLAGHEGFALFGPEAWPVTIHRLADKLKSYLRQEIARAEWHMVDDAEWDDELKNERAVLVGGARRQLDANDPAMSVLSVKPSDGTDEAGLPWRGRGNQGWMKVRGREGHA